MVKVYSIDPLVLCSSLLINKTGGASLCSDIFYYNEFESLP